MTSDYGKLLELLRYQQIEPLSSLPVALHCLHHDLFAPGTAPFLEVLVAYLGAASVGDEPVAFGVINLISFSAIEHAVEKAGAAESTAYLLARASKA